MARAVYTISIKPLSKDFLKLYSPLEPVETQGILDGAAGFIEGVVWAFVAQLPLKIPSEITFFRVMARKLFHSVSLRFRSHITAA